ncbi:single-stranded-DNA-specific exonuclease RecJ [Edaphobacter acidisoli]|uniref:Single-stranded-DNA-specific exonuclease RecJ n=1 Tax=Edaphobacter acidisoli TaxID=2040573 RepID=A0A916W0G0_9BACT|nr:single-stranded-DNA-specific exonuclease RecJ [Edaphobacter acidisoli]GGA56960.1 single-stranded-DNA-specific exonuclease RecJ [Edaphobacter acidisoli]
MPSATTATELWSLKTEDPAQVEQLATVLACPLTIAHLLIQRGLADPAAAHTYLNPSIDDLHDPMLMLGMSAAVERIQRAVAASEPILIYGDYDVDGTTATVLLKTAIERIAPKDKPTQVRYHVPHRLREGYGMQTTVLGDAAESGIRLVISVDTGIRAFAAAREARSLGLDLIVTDHHLPDEAVGIPDALAVINPMQANCPYPFKHLCGAAVAFKLSHAILAAAAQTDEQRSKLKQALIPSFLKLVAIATIADSVPLEGENRVIAALGLRELRNPVQPGLRALMQVAQVPTDRSPSATEVAFRIAPRINAAGRMDVASDVVELFLTRDPAHAAALAEKLHRLNDDRRAIEQQALDAIDVRLEALRSLGELTPACLVLDSTDWHRGVLGILASRVVERTSRPALVLTHEDGQAHGSGRSIPGFHLLDAITAADNTGPLFTRFGGHAHAVGFSLPSDRVELLRTRLESYGLPLSSEVTSATAIECDAELTLTELTYELTNWLERCGPYGIGNREPIFITRNATLAAPARIIKDKHICLDLAQPNGGPRLSALGWSRSTDWLARCAELTKDSRIDLAYRLRAKNNPQYPGLELELIDLRLA